MMMPDPEEMYPEEQQRLMQILDVTTMEEAQDFYIGLMEFMMETYDEGPKYHEFADFFMNEWGLDLTEASFEWMMHFEDPENLDAEDMS